LGHAFVCLDPAMRPSCHLSLTTLSERLTIGR
jgi:hypothetical protein